MGIKFFYIGGEEWIERTVHQFGSEVEQGCIGCGWYNFETWRQRPDICIN